MTTATIPVETAIDKVAEAVEKIVNDADQHFPAAATVGDAVRQGDVYIQLIDSFTETPPLYKQLTKPQFPIQLAPGNTKGSRHMLEESEGLAVYVSDYSEISEDDENMMPWELRNALVERLTTYAQTVSGETEAESRRWDSKTSAIVDSLSKALMCAGPIFVLKNPGCVSHPEHGNWILPAGTYRITFQRTLDSDMRVRRVFD